MLVDTHCHLDFNSFDGERDEVVERAKQKGVQRIVNPGINLTSSQAAIQLAERYPEVYAAVGIHPTDALIWQTSTIAQLEQLAAHPKVVAIGEIGLDYYRDRVTVDLQRKVLLEQLILAAKLNLPVILHLRNREPDDHSATEDMKMILSEWWKGLCEQGSRLTQDPGVLHSFSETAEFAESFVEMNFLIGITGPVTFKNAHTLKNVVGLIPLENILVETDSPFLTPNPLRGKRNEPANVRLIAEKIAEIKKEAIELVASATTLNARRLFSW